MKEPEEEEKINSIFKELGIALLELFAGSINSKAGLSILLSVLGFIFLTRPIVGENEKPLAFYIIGAILTSGAAYLLISRIIEIKNNKKYKKFDSTSAKIKIKKESGANLRGGMRDR